MLKKSMNLIKDIIISILILICIVLLLIVIFYDRLSITKVIPNADNYALSEKMQKELGGTKIDSTEDVIIKYNIDSNDLKKNEKDNEYDKGKSDPFGVVIKIENDIENNNNESSSINDNSGFYEDDGTK